MHITLKSLVDERQLLFLLESANAVMVMMLLLACFGLKCLPATRQKLYTYLKSVFLILFGFKALKWYNVAWLSKQTAPLLLRWKKSLPLTKFLFQLVTRE